VTDSPRTGRLAARLRTRAPDLLALAAIAALASLVWYFRVLHTAHVAFDLIASGDFYTQIYPMWARIGEWWRSGVLPLWNPYQYAGQPVLASAIYGVLYPPNVLYWFLEPALAIEVLAVGHLIIAGGSMYAFASTIGLGRPASVVAGASFMLSGQMMLHANWFSPAHAAAAWLPLALLALELLFRRTELWVAPLLALAVAFPFLGGWPQTWMYTLYVVVVYGAGRFAAAALSPEERPRLLRASVLGAAAGALAIAWIAPQLLPTLELQSLGPRRTGGLTVLQTMPHGPFTPSALLDDMVDSTPGLPRWAYLGIGALLLAPLSLGAARQRWRVLCFALLAAFSVCAVVAVDSPVHELYRRIGGSQFRVPARLLYVYTAAAAILAAIGFDVVSRLAERRATTAAPAAPARLRWGAAAGLAGLALAGLAAVPMPALSRVHLVATLTLASAALLAPWRIARRLAVFALAAWMIAELAASMENPFLHPVQNRAAYDRYRSAYDFVAEHQGLDRTYLVCRFDRPELMAKQGSLRGIYAITDYEPLSLSRYDRLFRLMEAPQQKRDERFTFVGALQADPTLAHFQLLDAMSVRFVVFLEANFAMQRSLALLAPKWRRAFASPEGALVYRNADPLPRAYLAAHAETVRSEDAALAALTSLVFDPRSSVIIEREEEPAPSAPAPTPIVPARIVRYEPARVEIEVEAPTAGWLVLTDTHYPGWQASVDGVAAPITQANYLFRAVWVEAGAHRVEFDYRPKSFRLGAAAAAGGLAAAAAVLGSEWRSRRVRARSPRSS
jgi:hypothetical protein